MIPQIADAELEVMKVLWERGEMTNPQIVAALTAISKWKPKTILTMLMRLVAKGAVHADKTNPKLFVYSAAVSRDQYRAEESRSFLHKVYDGSVSMLLTSFVLEQNLSDDDRAALMALLDNGDPR